VYTHSNQLREAKGFSEINKNTMVGRKIYLMSVATLLILIGIISLVSYNQTQSYNLHLNTLQISYDSLQMQYNDLQGNFSNIGDQYDTLLSNYNELLRAPGLTYDITDYGAIPDDQIDDARAFVKILSAHPSNMQIRIPSGTFLINTSIDLRNNDNVTILGEGSRSIIKLTTQDNIIRVESKNIVIKDLALDGNSRYSRAANDGITTGFHANNLLLQNVYIHNTTGHAIQVLASKNAIINNCRFENIGFEGVNSHISGGAICLNSVDGARITNNQINGFFGDGGIFTSGGGVMGFTKNVLIDNNTITGGHTDEGSGIHIWQGTNLIITNNIIHDSKLLYNSDSIHQGINGISIFYGDNIVLYRNEVYRVSGVGLEIHGINIHVVDNYVHKFIENGSYACGFWLSAANALLENNTIEDFTNFGILIGNDDVTNDGQLHMYPSNNEQIINNIIRDTKIMEHKDSSGIRIILEGGDKKYLTIRDNKLINNMYGIWKSGSGQLIDPILMGNTITGSIVEYVGITPTN